MHSALSLLSLVFQIPVRRIKEGTRIWPEFQLHSIVFALRSLACMLLCWIDEVLTLESGPRYFLNIVVVFGTLVAADVATAASVPPEFRSNTVRGFDYSPAAKGFFTTVQFLGTVGVLFGLRSYANYFVTVFVIQVGASSCQWPLAGRHDHGLCHPPPQTTAFTFTLRRKNLISHSASLGFYAFMLVAGILIGVTDCVYWAGVDGLFIFGALAAAAQAVRMLGCNKYALWAGMAVVVHYARRTTTIVHPTERYSWWPWWGWPLAYVAANVLVTAVTKAKEKSQSRARQ